MKKAITVIVIMVCIFSCTKLTVDCDYTVYSTIRLHDSVRVAAPIGNRVRVYGVMGDTMDWKVNSYSDAQQGIITSKTDPRVTKTAEYAFEESVPGVLKMHFTERPVMLIAYDTQDDIYAYRNANVDFNVPSMVISVILSPFRQDTQYMDLGWRMVNGRTVGEPKPVEE